MKLKVSRFHTHPSGGAARASARENPAPADAPAEDLPFKPEDDGFGDAPFPTARGAAPATPPGAPAPDGPPPGAAAQSTGNQSADTRTTGPVEIDAIKREGLTGRQLRMARRLAQKNNLPATSDFDAVRLLRKAGLDPFQKSAVLQLVGGLDVEGAASEDDRSHALTTLPGGGEVRLPQTIRPDQLPSTELRPEDGHAAEVRRIQQDIVRRRRRRLGLLWAKLAVFVLLPTLVAGWYFYFVATPMFTSHSEFVIQKATPTATGSFAGLLQGTSFANSQDSIVVQGYLQSPDAMARLDKDKGFRTVFQAAGVDPLQRLSPRATSSQEYKLYRSYVKISYDPTEGVIKMDVSAPKPQTAVDFSRALISYAEEQVDRLTQRMRDDQMKSANASYADAQKKLTAAQATLVGLQEKFKTLSTTADATLINTQISALQTQLTQEQLSLAQMQSNAQPSKARMDPVKNRIALLQAQIARLRDQITGGAGGTSLATVQSRLVTAQADVQTRQMMLAQATTALETARIEANRQTRYLSIAVDPTAPDEPSYPKRFQNTLVVMLIFAGLYLMLSMTIGILREQIAA